MNKTNIKNKCVSLEEFVNISNVKEKTVIKAIKIRRIPGATFRDGEYVILEGTRYPYNIRHTKFKNYDDRRYTLLKAISQLRYIDFRMLKIYPRQFKNLLLGLLNANLIEKNRMCNEFGANAYDITEKGSKYLIGKRRERIMFIAKLVSECAGTFAGKVSK